MEQENQTQGTVPELSPLATVQDKDPDSSASTTSSKRKAEWFEIDEDHNTYVYVSGLPTDLSEEDFIELMKKYGIIARKSQQGQPYNTKLYKNKDGSFKGDALCCYVRIESVELALNHLDGYQYDDKHVLQCEKAKFQMRGSYDPTKKPRADKQVKTKQKKNVEKLLSWDVKTKTEVKQKKVILKNMFSPEELLEDATLLLDLKEDVEEKCAELNCEPKRVDIYDKSPDGVIAVTFAEHEQALRCILALNNQYYAKRLVTADLWDGKTKYKIRETDEESQKRLEKWHADIQESGDLEDKNDKIATTLKEDNKSSLLGDSATNVDSAEDEDLM